MHGWPIGEAASLHGALDRFDSCIVHWNLGKIGKNTVSTTKEQITPGTTVIVNNKGKGISSPLVLTQRPGSYFDGYHEPPIGAELEILAKPKKYDGINVVKVKYKGQEYFSYYSALDTAQIWNNQVYKKKFLLYT